MACCLAVTKSLSNQCWNVVNWNLSNKLPWNSNKNSYIFIKENTFEMVICQIASILSWPQYYNHGLTLICIRYRRLPLNRASLYMQWYICIITLRPRQDGRHFAADIVICIFFNENFRTLNKILLKYVSKGLFNNVAAIVQIIMWCQTGNKSLSEAMLQYFIATYMHHLVSMRYADLTCTAICNYAIYNYCSLFPTSLQWRHNGHDSVSNHQPHDCLLNYLFGRRSK